MQFTKETTKHLGEYTESDIDTLGEMDVITALRLAKSVMTKEQADTVFTSYNDNGSVKSRLFLGEIIRSAIANWENENL